MNDFGLEGGILLYDNSFDRLLNEASSRLKIDRTQLEYEGLDSSVETFHGTFAYRIKFYLKIVYNYRIIYL